MTLGNTPSRQHDFHLEQSRSFAFTMRFHLKEKVNEVHVPYDMRDSVVRLAVKQPPHIGTDTVIFAFAQDLEPALGKVQFRLQASELDLEPGDYPYDITLISANGYSTPVMKGHFEISENADDDASNLYDFSNPNTLIGVQIDNGATVNVKIQNPDFLVGPPGSAGIFVQPNTPETGVQPPQYALWVDTDEAELGGSGGGGLFIQPDEPTPGTSAYIAPLWVDTDENQVGTGPAGPAGPPGPRGAGLEIKGVVPAFVNLPGGAAAGEAWVTSLDSVLYVSNGLGGWTGMGSIAGPPGADGATGPAGPMGPQGPQGQTGPAGAPGASGSAPPGAIMAYAGATAPAGWLLCDGSAVSRSVYSALWGVLGGTYGTGDGSTTLNLPNLEDRFPLGAGLRSPGSTGGASSVTLSTGNLPAHSHGVVHTHTTPNHTHSGSASGGAHEHGIDLDMHYDISTHEHENVLAASAGPGTGGTTHPATAGVVKTNNSPHSHSVAITSGGGGTSGPASRNDTDNAGGGQAHENMPPFLVLNYIIKV